MVKKMTAVVLGSLFVAIGINFFIIPNHLINGGMIGVGLIAKYALGFKPGLTLITLSMPLYIYAWFYFRNKFYNGLHGLLISAFFIDLLQPLSLAASPSLLFSSLIGGVFVGTGVGMMLLVKASTGGGDLLALMIAKSSGINVGIIILMIDIIVILCGGIAIQEATILYSFIMILMIGLTTYTITKRFS